MSASALICLAPGSEETEGSPPLIYSIAADGSPPPAVAGSDGSLTIVRSRGVRCWPMRRGESG